MSSEDDNSCRDTSTIDPLQIRDLADGQEFRLLFRFFASPLELDLHGACGRGRPAGRSTLGLAVIIVHVELDAAALAVFLQDVATTVTARQRGRLVADADQASDGGQIAGAPGERDAAGVLASNVVQCRVDVLHSSLHVCALEAQAVQLFPDLGHLGINV